MNYGDLKSHFNDLLNRNDISATLTARFIDQGLARIQRQLRIPVMEKQQVFTFTGQVTEVTLPSDFIEIINIYHSAGNHLTRVPMPKMREYLSNAYTGEPLYFTRQQAKLLLFPQPSDGTMTLDYYGELDAFTTDTSTTTLSTIAPELIIYAGLTFAADYYLDERAPIFEQKFTQFLTEIQEQSNDQELNGSTQVIQPAYAYQDDYHG